MKTATGGLETFLFTKQAYSYAHLYTITLVGGTVLRWTDSDLPITFGGHTWGVGPTISDGGVTQKIGLAAQALQINLGADARTTIGSLGLVAFARRNGFDGALVKVERIYFPFGVTDTAVGTVIRFSGRFSEILQASDAGVQFKAADITEVLDVNVPVDVWQSSCLNTLYDTRCGVSRASFKASVAVVSGSTTTLLKTNYGGATGTLNLGSLMFTSGALAGLRKTIKDQTLGNLTLVSPLLDLPGIGDALDLYPGCNLSMANCLSPFNNMANFRGQPFVPLPETTI